METVIALLVVILIGFWAVNILKPRKTSKKERMVEMTQLRFVSQKEKIFFLF